MNFETLKNDFLLTGKNADRIRFTSEGWDVWATLFALSENIAAVYYVDVPENRDGTQKYGFSFNEKAELAALVNRKTGRIIMPSYGFRSMLDDVPDEIEIGFSTLTREAAKKILDAAQKLTEKEPLPALTDDDIENAKTEARRRYIAKIDRKPPMLDVLIDNVPSDVLLDCFCEAPGWEKRIALDWLISKTRYGKHTYRESLLWQKAYEVAIDAEIKRFEQDASCVEHIQRDMSDAVEKTDAKNVTVRFLCSDGSESETKIESTAFTQYSSGYDGVICLWNVAPASERKRVLDVLGTKYSEMPVSAILKISYRGKPIWEKK